MPRMPRAVLPGVAHHLTQRGVDRQDVFFSDAGRHMCLHLISWAAEHYGITVLGYCLMTNHVHWVVIPADAQSLARAFGWAHGRYSQHVNTALLRSGHFWQNRFFSCALDERHTWAAVRYVERNPVRAGLVGHAEDWPWSSAPARLGRRAPPAWLNLEPWRDQFGAEQWRDFLEPETMSEAELQLRASTYTGRPAGSAEFIESAEARLARRLTPSKGGRPRRDSLHVSMFQHGGTG
jgi:REP-associated tyrosine transposase